MERPGHMAAVAQLLEEFPVVALLGPRQVGKSTLARELAARWSTTTHFDLEDPADLARLADPRLALADLEGLVVLDEVQRLPALFPLLRVLADRSPPTRRFLLLGSASPDLVRGASESLAGRIAFHELDGFHLDEVAREAPANEDTLTTIRRLWLRGGFPRSYLAASDRASFTWRRAFIRTFLERDVADLGLRIPATTLRRFWTMLAHYHGQTWNASELGRAFGVSDTTVRRYLDVLAGTFLVRVLQPWHDNLSKRQVKAPKVYLSDTGLLHALLDLPTTDRLESHPKLGASFEGLVIAELVARLGARWDECHFWATHAGAELDLLVVRDGRRLGFEVKHTSAPKLTPSMRLALDDLRLDRLDVVYPGDVTWPMAERVRALAVTRLETDLDT
ncbi:MAG: ATP-binding protein [Deltaproteobacteria bacterium]|nr:ATP-binding protein [Deltaproteobacteria bacterium]